MLPLLGTVAFLLPKKVYTSGEFFTGVLFIMALATPPVLAFPAIRSQRVTYNSRKAALWMVTLESVK